MLRVKGVDGKWWPDKLKDFDRKCHSTLRHAQVFGQSEKRTKPDRRHYRFVTIQAVQADASISSTIIAFTHRKHLRFIQLYSCSR